jgi:gluconolactonase
MHRWVLGAVFLVAPGVGCGAAGGDEADGAPDFTGPEPGGAGVSNTPGAAGGTGDVGNPTTPPTGNGAGGSAPASNGGAPVGSAGSSAGSVGEGNGGVGSLDPGGAGNVGQPPAGGSGPDVPPDPSGPFVSVPVNGGASAAFVCPDGPFGNPLQGMGAVQSVRSPDNQDFAFVEGPVWVGSQNRLFFSDNVFGRIWQIVPPFTTASIFLNDAGANGLAIDNEDQLLVADQSDRRITRVDATSAAIIETVVPAGNHTPNDLVLRSDDNLYFTDPNSGGRGFYRASPSGQLDGPFSQSNTPNTPGAPNGVVLSPDENTLYVGDVQQNFVAALSLEADGAIDTASAQLFVRTMGDTVDGMAVDCAGNLYVGTRTGVEVYAPDKTLIGTVPTGESSNATFGGADRRTLFVTSRAQLKFVTLGVPGLPD